MDTLEPKQLEQEAQAEYNRGDYQSAARQFKAAADGYSAQGDELLAAEMANNCSVALLKAGQAGSALDAANGTDLIFAAKGDLKRQAMALGNQAAALEDLKRFEDARQKYEQSAELLKEVGEYELRAYVLQALSSLQLRSGQYLEAYATMRAGVMGMKNKNLQQKILQALMEIPFKFLK